jgi:carbamoyl-phosphate synthase small subunit
MEQPCFGEVVFSTGMTGYVESLTDPSYAGQILVFTYPLIGNYGVPRQELWESGKIHAKGVIVSEACEKWSHYQGRRSFAEWLDKQGVSLLTGVDTRALTRAIRSHGSMPGMISELGIEAPSFPAPEQEDLLASVSISQPKTYGEGPLKVIAVDCGMKENILRHLCRFPMTVKRVPHDYDYSNEDWDGVFLSNGPGDPKNCVKTIAILQKAMERAKPIFGICLGTQLMALAAGARTYKLPFGHRGHNQPCISTKSELSYITSQNHGYAIAADSLPSDWRISYRNLNDGSVEGIEHLHLPFSAVQFHPEAAPGPTDTTSLFDSFYQLLLKCQAS